MFALDKTTSSIKIRSVLKKPMIGRSIAVAIALAIIHSYCLVILAQPSAEELIFCPMHNSTEFDPDCVSCDECKLYPGSLLRISHVVPAELELPVRISCVSRPEPLVKRVVLVPPVPELPVYTPPPEV